ncbi:hypothetical protein CKK33_03220 [Mucilaginibacter sp. MD40]|nr:hypothetical protein CKK33_03220 [Mucilaginibacter sp. MD40]
MILIFSTPLFIAQGNKKTTLVPVFKPHTILRGQQMLTRICQYVNWLRQHIAISNNIVNKTRFKLNFGII